ncbi:MAG: TIGR04282 family arsenosugar biosynthesis glycosyltransferase [Candidatus Sericytochromatia bacterium]|nr:TIGR04282 family arsenosugar biosynthesis glycosyltransferase [Candidatus Sericytochromatia bacterium]
MIIFIKYPEVGKVKSRLAKDIGFERATQLYKLFVHDLLVTIKKTELDLLIAIYPPEQKEKFIEWLGSEYRYIEQCGSNLGEKMKNAFDESFVKGYDNTIIIGSDSPDLESYIFDQALFALKEVGSVIGEAMDGGYYLIGFNKGHFLPQIFLNIEWSTSQVFENTCKIFNQYNHPYKQLKKWSDIDTLEDLNNLFDKYKEDISSSSTINFLKTFLC